jgi:cyanophycinase
MVPKGKLVIIGGHEDKGEVSGENLTIHKKDRSQSHFEILSTLIIKIPRIRHVIEIIASASTIAQEVEELYLHSYKLAGFTHVRFIRINSAEDAEDPKIIRRIKSSHVVFFTGGDQKKLVKLLNGSSVLKAIEKKYYNDKYFILAGTSAGAMAVGETIITGGVITAALYKGTVKICEGFGLIKNVLIDTHFVKRGRFARLAQAVCMHPECLGIGLEEDTALVISQGHKAKCIGSGMVIFIDGRYIKKTNIDSVKKRTPIVMDNLTVSIIASGSKYSLKDRKLLKYKES